MNVGIIIAEREELDEVHKAFKCNKFVEFHGITFYVNGNVGPTNLIFCYCGVGKANAAMATMCLINNFSIDHIINIGFCGAFDHNLKIGDIVFAQRAQYNDVDLVPFQQNDNCLPDWKSKYYCLSSNEQDKINQLKLDIKWVDLLTGDSVAKQKNINFLLRDYFGHHCVFDMEGMAIVHVCMKNGLNPWLIKIVSDNFSFDEKQRDLYKNSLQKLPKKNKLFLVDFIQKMFFSK